MMCWLCSCIIQLMINRKLNFVNCGDSTYLVFYNYKKIGIVVKEGNLWQNKAPRELFRSIPFQTRKEATNGLILQAGFELK
jgi:hypothetical protein